MVAGGGLPGYTSPVRIALISDLHASLTALDAVLADVDALAVDEVVCLGDIVDLGPEPQETVERLRDRAIRCVRGNHDALDEHPSSPLLAEVEAWSAARLDPPTRSWLASLPASLAVDLGGVTLLCVHGSPRRDTDQILASTSVDELEEWTDGHAFDVLACGHTHVQLVRRLGSRLLVNVGSVGMPFEQPFDGSPPTILPWCEYGIVSRTAAGISVELRRVALDMAAFEASLHRSGFPEPETWLASWASGRG